MKPKGPAATFVHSPSEARTDPRLDIEHWSIEVRSQRGSSPVNEDAFVCLERVYGVFDGLTSFGSRVKGRVTPGRAASACARAAFVRRSHDLATGAASLVDVAREANDLIRSWNEQHGFEPPFGAATNCAVARVSGSRAEWIQCADASILGIDESGRDIWFGRNQLIELEQASMTEMEQAIAGGATTLDELLESAQESDRHTYEMANRPGGYGVLNGDPAFTNLLLSGVVDAHAERLSRVVLLTDGLLIPGRRGSGAYLDYARTAKLLHAGGLGNLFTVMATLTAADANCLEYPRFKRRDDATGISLSRDASLEP